MKTARQLKEDFPQNVSTLFRNSLFFTKKRDFVHSEIKCVYVIKLFPQGNWQEKNMLFPNTHQEFAMWKKFMLFLHAFVSLKWFLFYFMKKLLKVFNECKKGVFYLQIFRRIFVLGKLLFPFCLACI
jgi:hypothetical protein